MVKKIDGPNSPLSRPTAIEPSKAVGPGKVDNVEQVQRSGQSQQTTRVRRPTRPMTSAEREHLFQLIREEADKIFGPNGLPESQRNTVEGAVKMAIDASIIDDEDYDVE